MKTINYFVAVLTALIMFSCSNGEDIQSPGSSGNEGSKKVMVKIASLKLKTMEETVPQGTVTEIQDAALLFYTGSTFSFSHVLTAAEIALLEQDGSESLTISGVPLSADGVTMIANYVASGQGTNYQGVTDANVIDVKNLQPESENGVEGVIMYGKASIGALNTANNTAQASLTISPIATRLEISGIGIKDGDKMTSYTLIGVFIPNHYPQGKISDCLSSSLTTGTGFGSLVKPSVSAYQSTFPGAAGTGYLNDFSNDGLTLADNNIFGFNMFPAVGADNLPNIVLAVKNVKYTDSQGNTDVSWLEGAVQYVTITTYHTEANGGGAQYEQFQNANVYGIKSLKFGLGDLGDEPYTKTKNVAVTLTVTPWTYTEIYPDI